ncbi:unnamed protein product [Penicillium pancosmium]
MLLKAPGALLSIAAIAHGWTFTTYVGGGCIPIFPSSSCHQNGDRDICCKGQSSGDIFGSARLTGSGWSVYAFNSSSCSGNLDDAATSWSDEDCHAVSSNDYKTFGIVRSDSVANTNSNQTIEWVNA